MQKTKIEYLTHSWNPIAMRCTPVSEGCENCWHLAIVKRFKNKPIIPELSEKELEAPLKSKKPSMIGVQFSGDLFHESVPFEWIDKVMAIITLCPQHTFQILTKHRKRMLEYIKHFYEDYELYDDHLWDIYTDSSIYTNKFTSLEDDKNDEEWDIEYEKDKDKCHPVIPLPNLHLGVTCENQRTADERIPVLLQIPAAVRFLSLEPLLEDIRLNPINFHYKGFINWVIIGCESGPGRRPCKLEWVRNIVDQCKAAGVPVFVKQLDINGVVEHDINKFPEDLKIREYPIEKKTKKI